MTADELKKANDIQIDIRNIKQTLKSCELLAEKSQVCIQGTDGYNRITLRREEIHTILNIVVAHRGIELLRLERELEAL